MVNQSASPSPSIQTPGPRRSRTSFVQIAQASLPTHQTPPQHWPLRGALIVVEALIGLTAIAGAIFILPALPREWLRQGAITPFTDYTIPALALGIVCGGSALCALCAVVVRPWIGAFTSIAAGLFMVGFELVEIAVVGFTPLSQPAQPQAWLQPFYLVVGTTTAVLGGLLWRALAGAARTGA